MRRIDRIGAGFAGVLLALLPTAAWAQGPAAPSQGYSTAPEKAAVVNVMSAVADWQLASGRPRHFHHHRDVVLVDSHG